MPAFSRLGCVVYKSTRFQFFAPPAGFALDECHVDKSGNWLMLLEVNPNGSVQNRIVDLLQGTITTIDDLNGSLGHLDMGFGYAVGADNFNSGSERDDSAQVPGDHHDPTGWPRRPLQQALGHRRRESHRSRQCDCRNARESQYACGSNASRVPDMADEIVCFSLNPNRNADGSLDVLVVGQVMTDLDAARRARFQRRRLHAAAEGQSRRHRQVFHLDDEHGRQPP